MILNVVITISDWIQIGIAIITLVSVIISLIIAILTLKQNTRMIENSTKPSVIIYKDILDINSPLEYLVIKNVGNSLAYITSIEFDKTKLYKISDGDIKEATKAFDFLNNSTLAPQQLYRIPINTKNLEFDTITFDIFYSDGVKKYKEQNTIYLKQDQKIPYIKQHQSNNELKVISNAIQELIKRIS